MAKKRQSTLPEKKRTDSTSGLQIIGIEKNDNKVFMSIHGCHITAVFQDHNNTEVYGRVKEILIDSILRKNLAKI